MPSHFHTYLRPQLSRISSLAVLAGILHLMSTGGRLATFVSVLGFLRDGPDAQYWFFVIQNTLFGIMELASMVLFFVWAAQADRLIASPGSSWAPFFKSFKNILWLEIAIISLGLTSALFGYLV